jgi:hypothetical protein
MGIRRRAAVESVSMRTDERSAGFSLIETGTLAEFELTASHVESAPDGETRTWRSSWMLGGPEAGEGDEQVEWAAFGFMYVLAVLSFADARPRGHSEMHFVEEDEFTVADFFEGLRFVRGELHHDLDYVRGRCLKTSIRVRRSGEIRLGTRGRGESALFWIDRLKGKKPLQLVS